jgi:hypothetical protein
MKVINIVSQVKGQVSPYNPKNLIILRVMDDKEPHNEYDLLYALVLE